MNTTVRLAAHLFTFGSFLALFRPATVEPAAWLAVFTVGWVFLILAPDHRVYPRTTGTWIKAALYTLLLASLFFGTDFAGQHSQAQGNLTALSWRPRTLLVADSGSTQRSYRGTGWCSPRAPKPAAGKTYFVIANNSLRRVRPNPSLKRSANGSPPGPVRGAVAFSTARAWRATAVSRLALTLGRRKRHCVRWERFQYLLVRGQQFDP